MNKQELYEALEECPNEMDIIVMIQDENSSVSHVHNVEYHKYIICRCGYDHRYIYEDSVKEHIEDDIDCDCMKEDFQEAMFIIGRG